MNVLSISEYHELVKMLRSSKDDREIVIENLKNLDVDDIYKIFVLKSSNLDHREDLLKPLEFLFDNEPFKSLYETVDRKWGGQDIVLDLSWSTLHKLIKENYSDNQHVKNLFELVFKSETESTIIKALSFDFVDTVETTIKW
tara:strand:- start:644 stop:1069 length:426 start_codon:yes stop_codon:yes gene_type:complete